ncbi:MAG: ribosome small subunit-dependent GTPase A [Gemmatimonadota bacterium]|nr:MAG: ribosome small subunit-dependent GTPase A [Gemmatimonadota bacterium]
MVRLVRGGVYVVALEDGTEVEASLRGRLKLEERDGDQVVIGDRVVVADVNGDYVVEEILPRKTQITRVKGGRQARVLVANADRLAVVVAAKDPRPRRALIDRLLVVGESGGVAVTLVINKMDLPGAPEIADGLAQVYESIGYPVLRVSANTGEGVPALQQVVSSGIVLFAGPSGAGKSSLVNALEPGLNLPTGELSRRAGTGRHTTVTSRLISLSLGGLLADTPGFSEVGLWGVDRSDLDWCFPEFRPHRDRCRFRSCSHLTEPDCGVQAALEAGDVDADRFESYRSLWEEAG